MRTVRRSFTTGWIAAAITGTLTHLEIAESPGSEFPPGTGTTTYAVTLR